MNEHEKFLLGNINNYDLITIFVTGAPRIQNFVATVEHIYSCCHGITAAHLGLNIEFVGGTTAWGNSPLEIGQRAFLFIRDLDGVFYECHWRGHMVIELMGTERYAVLQFPNLWLREDLPLEVRSKAEPHPTEKNMSIVPFTVMETYLKSLIQETE